MRTLAFWTLVAVSIAVGLGAALIVNPILERVFDPFAALKR